MYDVTYTYSRAFCVGKVQESWALYEDFLAMHPNEKWV